MSDYIKREDVVARIITYGKAHEYDDNPCIAYACKNLERQMNAIPSADVVERASFENLLKSKDNQKIAERKVGRWIAEIPSSPSAGYLKLLKRLREPCQYENCILCQQAADAIEELQQIAEHYEESARDYFKDVCYYLERVPKWIPVTERLPEKGVSVLVCFDFKGRKSVDVAELWSDGGFHNYSDDYLTPEGRKYRTGTHWMQLPEPPKEVDA